MPTGSHDCLWDNRWFCILFVGSKIRGNPKLSALCLALLGWAGTLVSTNWSQALAALILYRLLAKNAHRFSSTFWSFLCWFDCTKWLCTIIYCARMCTFKRSDGFSIVFTTFLVLFEHQILMWVISNGFCSQPQDRLDALCAGCFEGVCLWEASTGAPLRRWTTELPVDRVW